MLLDIYYKIWVDGITKLRSRPENKGIWIFYAMTFISMAMAMNLITVITIIEKYVIKHSFYDIQFTLFTEQKLNQFLNFFILYLLLPLLINYTLIFRNKRYENLANKYKYHNGKLCITYLMISYFLPFILLIGAFLLGIG
jgi:hypothetical protein